MKPLSHWLEPMDAGHNPDPDPEPETVMDPTTPEGFRAIEARVYVNNAGRICVTAEPDDVWPGYIEHDGDHPHNCDAMGCGWEHVIVWADVGEPPRAAGGHDGQ